MDILANPIFYQRLTYLRRLARWELTYLERKHLTPATSSLAHQVGKHHPVPPKGGKEKTEKHYQSSQSGSTGPLKTKT